MIILKKRINILLIGVFTALFILAGCGKGTVKETELYQKVQASGPENTLGTVLFLGYHETIDEKLVSELPQALAELPLIQMGGGEIYAIIPRYEGETITLNSVLWSEEMSAKTIKAEPKNSTYLDTYAWILYKEERYTEAKLYIDQALAHLSDSTMRADLLEHAGDIYWAAGLRDQALAYWRQAVSAGSSNVADLQKKIAGGRERKQNSKRKNRR